MKNALPRFRNRRKLTNLFFIALIAIACTQASANTNLAPASDIQTAAKDAGPIKDDQGRIRYIVDLVDDFSDKPASFADAKSVIDYRTAKSGKLINDVVKLQGIELQGTTSFVGTSFVAYLTAPGRRRLVRPDVGR